MNIVLTIISVISTIVIFLLMTRLYKRVTHPLLVPIATTTFVILIFLLIFSIPYETYMLGGKWIDELLGPAVVALAYPLYQNRKSLKEFFMPIIIGVFVGSTTGIATGLYFSKIVGIDPTIILSISPKSVTTPVAMDIASVTGGIPALAAVYVMIAGISGAMFGPILLKWVKVDHFVGVGLGFGTASHGIGTSRALEIGTNEGAISSIAMILSAVYTSIILPVLVSFLL
ncbi:LrgB family protein [Fredinandcohnia sp. QZ13]|uniref:LrgB family protein n=1 Tax=Fredinandcohnia sp. QZ13 TaxID=3073144 RepID=UPI0028535D4D|nr:LrgB family protein [Fredinandcohnia sp. QZ13]MDR4889286.1 LrgB family protein [Fredinandcohnia sp. QZ13]